jgi:hypothetical protein
MITEKTTLYTIHSYFAQFFARSLGLPSFNLPEVYYVGKTWSQNFDFLDAKSVKYDLQ